MAEIRFFSITQPEKNMSDTLDTKILNGQFWYKDGAIADTRRLAVLSLSHPDSNILDALSMMINVHTKAFAYSENILKNQPTGRMWKQWRRQSKCALWRYNALWRLCIFFVYL